MPLSFDPHVLRTIDANLNRAREGLRVMEEYARFVLDDAALSAAMKETRHALAAAVPQPLAADLVRHRDILGDVGTEFRTNCEYTRSQAHEVAMVAGKRLGEALRTIEEYGKIVDPAFAAAIERIRYRGYELERRLALTVDARARFGGIRLYVLLTEALCRDDWFATAEAVLRGGADALQLREKSLSDRELLIRATRLAALCRDQNKILVINDRPDIAAASHAQGVHLGQDDVSVAAARRILPTTCLIGVSTHNLPQVEAAAAEVPDYIAVGPMFASGTKPQPTLAGPETLAAARRVTSLPLVAVGGIDEHNASQVLSTAPCCLCVCQSIISQPDVAAAASRLRTLLDRPTVAAPIHELPAGIQPAT